MAHFAFVCQPHDRLRSAQRTSVAIVTANLAAGVFSAGHRVTVLAADASSAEPDSLLTGMALVQVRPSSLTADKVKEFAWGHLGRQPPFLTRDGYCARYLSDLLHELKALRPDVIVLPTFAQWLPSLAHALPNARLVLQLHDELWSHPPRQYVEPMLEHAAHVICVNAHIHRQIVKSMPALRSRVSVLHNGVDAGLFRDGRPRVYDACRLVYAGRLSPEKGLHVLAAALARMHPRFPDLQVDLIGDPGYIPLGWVRAIAQDDPICAGLLRFYGKNPLAIIRSQLIERGRDYLRECLALAGPAGPAFAVHGFVPQAALRSYFDAASVVVCPSVCNEIPMSAYEGMATGCPAVLSYDLEHDGPIAQGETALVVPRADPDSLADALTDLLSDPARLRSLGEAAQRTVLGGFTWGHASAKLLQLCTRLLES